MISVRIVGDTGFVWGSNLVPLPHVKEMVSFFQIEPRNGIPMVISAYGYNADAMRGSPSFDEARKQVFANGKIETPFAVPTSCPQIYLKGTPLKTEMVRAIENSIATNKAVFPLAEKMKRVKIVIADFDPDFPEALVYLPGSNEVLHVALHDTNPSRDQAAMLNGLYPILIETDPSNAVSLRRKILATGSVRYIDVR